MVNSFAESADLQRTGAMSPSTCAVLPERLRLDHRGGPMAAAIQAPPLAPRPRRAVSSGHERWSCSVTIWWTSLCLKLSDLMLYVCRNIYIYVCCIVAWCYVYVFFGRGRDECDADSTETMQISNMLSQTSDEFQPLFAQKNLNKYAN